MPRRYFESAVVIEHSASQNMIYIVCNVVGSSETERVGDSVRGHFPGCRLFAHRFLQDNGGLALQQYFSPEM